MIGTFQRQFLAELSDMQQTGRKVDPDQERSVGPRLAARLPEMIAAAGDAKKRRPVRRHMPS